MNIACIIPARGGSKGIPKKNILPIAGKPLIGWSIDQARASHHLTHTTYVSSDSPEILEVSAQFGAKPILRPDELSTDTASSEAALHHAVSEIEAAQGPLDAVVFLQATSPLRLLSDVDTAISIWKEQALDSLFAATPVEDFFIWTQNKNKDYISLNYDYQNRKRRQDVEHQVVENGSIYVFKPEILKNLNNRLGGKIGISQMQPWQVYEIDSPDDITLCEFFIQTKLLNRRVTYE